MTVSSPARGDPPLQPVVPARSSGPSRGEKAIRAPIARVPYIRAFNGSIGNSPRFDSPLLARLVVSHSPRITRERFGRTGWRKKLRPGCTHACAQVRMHMCINTCTYGLIFLAYSGCLRTWGLCESRQTRHGSRRGCTRERKYARDFVRRRCIG